MCIVVVLVVLYVYCCTCCSMCVFLWYLLFYMCIVVLVVLCVYCCGTCCSICVLLYLLKYTHMCIAGVTLDAELLARDQYSEGPATGHLDTGFSWLPCIYKQMFRWLPRFQVATTCFSRSPPDLNLNLSVTSFIFCLHVK